MRAVLLPGDRQARIVELDKPTPGPGQVVIEVKAAGLCGSDIHMLYRVPAAERRQEIMKGLSIDPDIVGSHEPAGVVTEVGSGVTHLRPGDRVAVAHLSGCGVCLSCRRGWDIDCPDKTTYGFDRHGAMADFMLAEAKDCAILPPSISFAEGAFYACGAGTGYWALRRGQLGPSETVTIVGLGPVGVAAAYFAKQAGAWVIGVDPVAERREFALSHGVDVAIDPTTTTVGEAVQEHNGGQGADLVIDASGVSAGRSAALDAARTWGRVVFVGFGDDATTLDIGAQIIQKQLTVLGAWVYSTPDLQQMLHDVARRGYCVQPLILHEYDLADAPQAWRDFDAGSLGKSMVVWR
ncbi:alcohol dehydrogenase [Micromonospora qiuiae]|uniref:Alcohol dehydrogenase n=1 Tax=Micromonospora qiuiae TaxID=502268 RepID=A0ABQ4JI77_9ACTN|nr:zinc-binding dehydrogenase [Micromonospora qiuiae]GIJ30313.1 alcohol dehydrogenase [Micromonospora qiuiae]